MSLVARTKYPGTYVLLLDTFAIDVRASRQEFCDQESCWWAIAILLSRSTAAIAILEAALKQMHVAFICALLHGNMNHLPFTGVFFLLAASACCLLAACACVLRLASCVLVPVPGAGACQYWRAGSCVRPYVRRSRARTSKRPIKSSS
jgi:hypothetical protein